MHRLCFRTTFRVWPQSRGTARILTAGAAGVVPQWWRLRAEPCVQRCSRPRARIARSAHTWPKGKSCPTGFVVSAVLERGSKQSFSISIKFQLRWCFQVNVSKCRCLVSEELLGYGALYVMNFLLLLSEIQRRHLSRGEKLSTRGRKRPWVFSTLVLGFINEKGKCPIYLSHLTRSLALWYQSSAVSIPFAVNVGYLFLTSGSGLPSAEILSAPTI